MAQWAEFRIPSSMHDILTAVDAKFSTVVATLKHKTMTEWEI